MRITERSAPPPVFRNQQVAGSCPAAGSNPVNDLGGNLNHADCWQGAYRVAYRWLLRLIGRSPVAHLGTPDDLATEQRIAEFTRKVRG